MSTNKGLGGFSLRRALSLIIAAAAPGSSRCKQNHLTRCQSSPVRLQAALTRAHPFTR